MLDYANRHMDGVEFLKNLPANQGAQIGVLDIRTNAVESPQMIADRVRKVVKAVPADKVTLSTDCGMKPLARMVAKLKLHALSRVRQWSGRKSRESRKHVGLLIG